MAAAILLRNMAVLLLLWLWLWLCLTNRNWPHWPVPTWVNYLRTRNDRLGYHHHRHGLAIDEAVGGRGRSIL